MCKDTIIPNWAKWSAGLALLAIALAAGTLGLVLNVSHGLEAGIAFGLADGAKVLIPLAAGIIGWSRQMKITAAGLRGGVIMVCGECLPGWGGKRIPGQAAGR